MQRAWLKRPAQPPPHGLPPSAPKRQPHLELGVVQPAQDVVSLSVRVVHGVLQPFELGVQAGQALGVVVAGSLRRVPLQLQGVTEGPGVPAARRQGRRGRA